MAAKKVWITIVVVLVVLNIITLAFLWREHYNPPGERARGAGPERYMERRLGLDEEQARQFRQARQRHFEKVRPVERALRKTRRALFMNMNDRPAEDISEELAAIAALHKQLDSLTYAHFMELRSHCTPEQSGKLDRMIQGLIGHPPGPQRRRGRTE